MIENVFFLANAFRKIKTILCGCMAVPSYRLMVFLLGCVLIPFSVCVDASPSQDVDILLGESGLADHTVVSGDFKQSRFLQGFSQPLSSSGAFVFWRGYGVYWSMLKPFSSSITYTESKTLYWGEGRKLENIESLDLVQRQASQVIIAMLGADIKSLSDKFNVRAEKAVDVGWALTLTPLNPLVKNVISEIVVHARENINKIVVLSLSGDETHIEFSNVKDREQMESDTCRWFFEEVESQCALVDELGVNRAGVFKGAR